MKTKRHFLITPAACLSVGLTLLASSYFGKAIAGNEFPVVLDASFDVGTGPNLLVNAVAVQADGKVMVGGDFTIVNGVRRRALARLNADGSLDTAFDPHIADDPSRYVRVDAMALQTNGQLIISGSFTAIAGFSRPGLARLNADGSLDASFSSRTTAFSEVAALVVQNDGKLLVGGGGDGTVDGDRGRIARLNSDGSVDATFHAPAVAFERLRALVVQTNGLIVAGTSWQNVTASSGKALVRLNADGSTDASFNVPLEFNSLGTLVEGLALQQDGKLLVSGTIISVGGNANARVARLNTDGSLDASFDAGGAIYAVQNQVRVLSSGQVLVTGRYVNEIDAGWQVVALLNSDGSLDPGFALDYGINGGITTTAIQPDGNIIIGGQFSSNGNGRPHNLARLFADGVARHSLGFTFDVFSAAETEGRVTITLERRGDSSGNASVHYATSDGTGKAGVNYVAQSGMVNFAPLQRSNSFRISLIDDGIPVGERTVMLSLSDASEGVILGPVRTASLVIKDSEIPAIVDGSFQAELPPSSFNANLASSLNIRNLLVQPDGKILLGGWTNYDYSHYSLLRLNPNGTRDSSFTARFESANAEYASVYSLVRQADGKFLATGVFSEVNGAARHSPVRLDTDGSLDISFVSALEEAELLAVQPNGKILASGNSDHAWMQRLNTDGSNDPTFNIGFNVESGSGSQITSINALSNGKILLAVRFNNVPTGVELVLLYSDGSVDIRFQPGRFGSPDSDATIECVQVLSSGKILVGGLFSSIGSFPRNGLARLNADGSLDTAFDPHIADGPSRYVSVNAMALQTNGQLIISGSFEAIAGFSRPGLARLNSDGSLDQNYFAPANFGRNSQIALQPNDQLLIAWGPVLFDALPRGNLTRLNADGTRPAVLFHAAQFAASEGSDHADIRVDRIGDIRSSVSVSYSTSDGSAKAGQDYQATSGTLAFGSFETSATFSIPLIDNATDNRDLTVQIALASPSPGITLGLAQAVLTIADSERPGSLDDSFHWLPNTNYLCDDSGFYVTSPIVLQADGKILLAYSGCTRNSLLRLNADGSIDSGFRPLLPGNFYHSNLILQPDGKILVQSDTALVRLNPDGSADTGFAAPSFPNGGLSGAVMQYPARPIIYGNVVNTNGVRANYLSRLSNDGTLDPLFQPSLASYEAVGGVVAQPDGKLVILKYDSRTNQNLAQLIRLLPDGSRDASFTPPPTARFENAVVVLQLDGKLLITQEVFPESDGDQYYSGLIRLNVNGSPDDSFISLRLAPSGYGPRAMLVQPDGKILVGGAGPYYESSDALRSGVARLNADGSLDTTFDVGLGLFDLGFGFGIASAEVSALALQPDGQVLIGGYFTSFNGIPALGLARLNGDGTPRFTSINVLNTGEVRLDVNVQRGRTVVIEASSDLRQWIPLHTNTTSSANFEYVEPGVTGTPPSFLPRCAALNFRDSVVLVEDDVRAQADRLI